MTISDIINQSIDTVYICTVVNYQNSIDIINSIRNCRVSSLGLMNTSTSHLDLPYPAGLVELQTLEISLSKIHDVVKSLVQLLIIRNSYNGALSCSYHSARAAYMEYLDL